MALTRYEPLGALAELQREMNRMWGNVLPHESSSESVGEAADWRPAVDIREEDAAYVLHADLPGVDASDVHVTVDGNVLTIRGSRSTDSEVDETRYRRIERVTGSYFRQFSLPEAVDQSDVSAKFSNGVLEVTVPKGKGTQPRSIPVAG